jgi:NADPH-dependent 2,4-dienoyl-CoA reductase/sulfur reductase-like enzyme
VATVGALSNPGVLEEIIASGKADVVEIARGLICDPDLPNKAREGRSHEIVTCMRCFTCFSNLILHGHIVCALNPGTGNEFELKNARPPAKRKKILVAGGGIAGMEAALTCAERGHEVILCEKNSELGGILKCERNVPFKKHLHEYLKQQTAKIAEADIVLRLDTAVTKGLADSIAPDAIIAAIGSKPLVPEIPGIDGANVVSAEYLYRYPDRAGAKVIIMGGGLVGSELAIFLCGLGKDVTIMEMAPMLNAGDNILQGMAISNEVARLGIKLELGVKVTGIDGKGVLGESVSGLRLYEADTVVCAAGLVPLREEAEELRFCAPGFYQIGDCASPKNIYEATRVAHQVALDIGTN